MALRDLTDPEAGSHAIQVLVDIASMSSSLRSFRGVMSFEVLLTDDSVQGDDGA